MALTRSLNGAAADAEEALRVALRVSAAAQRLTSMLLRRVRLRRAVYLERKQPQRAAGAARAHGWREKMKIAVCGVCCFFNVRPTRLQKVNAFGFGRSVQSKNKSAIVCSTK